MTDHRSGSTYTITLARPINAADRVTITISATGSPPYTRRLDVLPGDVNDDGMVNAQDVAVERNAAIIYYFLITSYDITGDGQPSMTDYNTVRRLVSTKLPPLR